MAAVMADSEDGALPKLDCYRAKRTEAMPKHSLFGCDLEIHGENEKSAIKDRDLKAFEDERQSERVARQNRYKAMLPEDMKKKLPANEIVEHSRSELAKQLQQASAARQALDSLEKGSKFFQVGVHGVPRKSVPRSRESGSAKWVKQSDLDHAEDINILGLGDDHKNYDHQRFSTRPPVHKYSLQGDLLVPGMDLSETEPKFSNTQKAKMYEYKRHRAPDWLPKEFFMSKPVQDPAITSVELPSNIQHQFGTKVCRNVLSNSEKVQNSLQEQQRLKAAYRRSRGGSPPKAGLLKQDIDPLYESLGNALRQDMFPGLTNDHTVSMARSAYTDEVHKRRVKDPDEWRYHRDELSIWAEQDVINQRLKKKWQEYEDSKPELLPNWDRNAKRPPPAPRPQGTKPKPPMKRTKKQEAPPKVSSSPFEDVVFKTPPLTPPPPKPDLVKKPSYTRDDAFWEFYDQETPR